MKRLQHQAVDQLVTGQIHQQPIVAQKSTPMMGNCTAASKIGQMNAFLLKDRWNCFSPQQGRGSSCVQLESSI